MAACRLLPVAEQGESVKFGVEIPFVHHLGFELLLFDGGASELAFEARPEHLNSYGITHGGASMTLLDVTMAVAARSVQKDMGVVTIEMKTSFMRPAKGRLTAKGKLLHRTQTLAFTEASLWDQHGRLCAQASGTFKYARRSVAADGHSAQLGAIATD